MKWTTNQRIMIRGFEDHLNAKEQVKEEILRWWRLQEEKGPLPELWVSAEKSEDQVSCELEILDSPITWIGSGEAKDLKMAVRDALKHLYPKFGSGAGVSMTFPAPMGPPAPVL